ncbi:hypothetical protein WJX74_008414 [Apatococcus lobatus]|uniref:Uncharacterized protein n=1 Tax=Apatococcus lobatus TaxID=904363 RepID=A0AAW1QWY7_9CHLO
MEELLARGAEASGDGHHSSKVLMTASEAEQVVQRLRTLSVDQVGSREWVEQHDAIERLNLQAHHNAQSHSDEFVMEALVSHDKLGVLVQDLLAYEVWAEQVFPFLKQHFAKELDSVTAYMLLHHEASVTNLLEVCMFHQHACDAVGEDVLLEVCDWCYRHLLWLYNLPPSISCPPERDAKALINLDAEVEQDEKMAEIQFGTAMCSLTILRYLTEHGPHLPLSVTTRLADALDAASALVPVMQQQPWSRRIGKREERFQDGRWQPVEASHRLRVCQPEAQVWLTLHNLVADPACRGKLAALRSESGRDALLSLRSRLTEPLLDQMPPLGALQRALNELALGALPTAPGNDPPARLIIEQARPTSHSLPSMKDWASLAARQQQTVFGPQARQLSQKRMEAMLQAFDFMCELQPKKGSETSQAGTAIQEVVVKSWRKVQGEVYETWSSFTVSIDDSKAPEPVELKDETSGLSMCGQRLRLKAIPADTARALPACGKLMVRYSGASATAAVELPAPATRASATELPQALWVTAGLLATDGLVLQLKLRQKERLKDRDRLAGTWYAYEPVGGAITVADSSKEPHQMLR